MCAVFWSASFCCDGGKDGLVTPSLQGEVDVLYLVLFRACGNAPFVFSLTLCCLPPSLLFLVSGFLDGRAFSRISQKPESDVVFRKGKVQQSFFERLTPSQVRDAWIQAVAVASDAANPGYFHVFVYGCAAAAMASAFAYLFVLDVGISAAASNYYEECAILSSGTFASGTDLSAAAAFADEVTLVTGVRACRLLCFALLLACISPVPLICAGSVAFL